MLVKQLKQKLPSIVKNEFDQAQLILVYAGARPAATFSVPKLRITEVTDFIKKIGLQCSIGRINEDAEIIVGNEDWRVKALAEEFLKISSSVQIPPTRAPYARARRGAELMEFSMIREKRPENPRVYSLDLGLSR